MKRGRDEWMKKWMSQWMSQWVSEYTNEWSKEGRKEWMNKWIYCPCSCDLIKWDTLLTFPVILCNMQYRGNAFLKFSIFLLQEY